MHNGRTHLAKDLDQMQKLSEVYQVKKEGSKEQKVQRAGGRSELRMIGALEDRDKLGRETATKPPRCCPGTSGFS